MRWLVAWLAGLLLFTGAGAAMGATDRILSGGVVYYGWDAAWRVAAVAGSAYVALTVGAMIMIALIEWAERSSK